MDLANIVWGDGLVLTDPVMTDRIGRITSHQITKQDFAEQFVWGSDIDLGGYGVQAAKHLNGTIVDARFFGDGDDSDAIQRAIDWLGATDEATGIVYLSALATQWALTATINVPSGIWLVAHPDAEFSLDFNGYMFTLASGAADVLIEGIKLDGNGRTGGLVAGVSGNTDRVTIRRCQTGLEPSGGGSFINGYLFDGATTTHNRLTIEDCIMLGGGAIVNTDFGQDIRILRNRLPAAATRTSTPKCIDLGNCLRFEITGNVIYAHDATTPFENAIYLLSSHDGFIRDNYVLGSSHSAVMLDASDRNLIADNEFLNGATAGTLLVDDVIVLIRNGSDRNHIRGNVITGVNALAGGVPINALYALAISNGVGYGTACTANVVENNLFSTMTNSLTFVGEYHLAGGAVCWYDASTLNRHNTYFSAHSGSAAIAGGAATEAITVAGFVGAFGQTVKSVVVTAHGAAAQALRVHAMSANTITIGKHDGTNLAAGTVSWHIDG